MPTATGQAKYKLLDPGPGYPDPYISKDSTLPLRCELGRICYAKDMNSVAGGSEQGAANFPYGIAELIFLEFTGTVNAGDFVIFDRFQKTCTQSPTAAATAKGFAIGISMAAQQAGSFGWVMIRGIHDAANVVTGTAAGASLSGSAVAGQASTAVVNYGLSAARCVQLAAGNIAIVELYWPFVDGVH